MDEPTLENLLSHLSISLQSEFASARLQLPAESEFWEQLIERVLKSSRDLLTGVHPDWPQAMVSTKDPMETFHWIEFALGYEIALEVIDTLKSRVEAMFYLARMTRPGDASGRTKRLFALVGRSYVVGHAFECAVMLGAMIEAEIEAEIPNDDCVKLLLAAGERQRRFDFVDKLAVALKTFKLTPAGYEAATRIRATRNRCMHRSGRDAVDIEPLIQDALLVLRELDGTTGPP